MNEKILQTYNNIMLIDKSSVTHVKFAFIGQSGKLSFAELPAAPGADVAKFLINEVRAIQKRVSNVLEFVCPDKLAVLLSMYRAGFFTKKQLAEFMEFHALQSLDQESSQ